MFLDKWVGSKTWIKVIYVCKSKFIEWVQDINKLKRF